MARRVAILIANQTFADGSGFASLRGPYNDVDALERVLTDPERGAFELAVSPLKDGSRAQIIAVVEQTLIQAGRDDTVLIHYSGHGKPDVRGRLHFAASDSHQDRLRTTAIRVDELHEMAAESRCRAIILLLDCCYSGAIGKTMSAGLRGETAELMRQQLRETAQDAQGLFILTSSTGWQTSEEVESEEDGKVMGRFTRAVVQRIESEEPKHRGDILFSHLTEHVRGAFPGQDARHFVADASGDPLVAYGGPRLTVAERRQRLLSRWVAEGLITPGVYGPAYEAAGGEGRSELVSLAAELLDAPETTPKSFSAAWQWKQATPSRPPIQQPKRSPVIDAGPMARRDVNRRPGGVEESGDAGPPPPNAKQELWPPRNPLVIWRDSVPGLAHETCPEMVTLPPGCFVMGAPETEAGSHDNERPQREVRIDQPFALGKFALTFLEWDAALAAAAPLPKLEDQGWGRGRRPVNYVRWEDAQAYIEWLNDKVGLAPGTNRYRLPSEAEWEYACRAGTTTPFSSGNTISLEHANFGGLTSTPTFWAILKSIFREPTGPVGTVPVGSFPANAFGLHDMHGNVWEWVQDCYRHSYAGAPTDGRAVEGGSSDLHVQRGGSWSDHPGKLRSAYRYSTIFRDSGAGFRVARTL